MIETRRLKNVVIFIQKKINILITILPVFIIYSQFSYTFGSLAT